MGSKSRIAKYVVPIIQKYIDENNLKGYIDIMVGGANIIDKIKTNRKIGSDINEYLIELYKNLYRLNELPEFVTKEHYSEVRNSYNNKTNEFEKWYIGAIGFLASYNGRFFDGGYAGLVNTKANTTRNYYDEAKRNLQSQVQNLNDIKWVWADYRAMNKNINQWLIYCNPPYKDTKQYGINKTFNHGEFWQWVREMSVNNIVLVSECQAPEDMTCIWQQEVTRTIDNTKRVNSVESLYIYNQS
jgi:DNA adenine methylase